MTLASRGRRGVRLLAAALCLLSAGADHLDGAVPSAARGPAAEPRLMAEAPGVWRGFEHEDLEGELWNADALLGRVVLLDFWATWCAPCLAELPNLRRIHQELAGPDFVLLGVSLDRTGRAPLRSFLLRHEMGWPQLHDGRGLAGGVARRFGVEAVPRTVVVDRQGRMVAVDLRGEALHTLIRDLLRLPPRETSRRIGESPP